MRPQNQVTGVWDESTPATREGLSVYLEPHRYLQLPSGLTGKSVFGGCLKCQWQGDRLEKVTEVMCCQARDLLEIRPGSPVFIQRTFPENILT